MRQTYYAPGSGPVIVSGVAAAPQLSTAVGDSWSTELRHHRLQGPVSEIPEWWAPLRLAAMAYPLQRCACGASAGVHSPVAARRHQPSLPACARARRREQQAVNCAHEAHTEHTQHYYEPRTASCCAQSAAAPHGHSRMEQHGGVRKRTVLAALATLTLAWCVPILVRLMFGASHSGGWTLLVSKRCSAFLLWAASGSLCCGSRLATIGAAKVFCTQRHSA